MKTTVLYLFLFSIFLSSCTWTGHYGPGDDNQINLTDLLQSYDLWYVYFDRTEGRGNIDFMSKAFTLSFRPNYELFANNNMVGLGRTGGGYGIDIGYYRTDDINGILTIVDDLSGTFDFEVTQISYNEISLYNPERDVRYFLVGYTINNFDFDQLFYDNVTYFLQEYEAWRKFDDDIISPSAPFTNENFLSFYVEANTNVFNSSEDLPSTPLAQIYWDYSGVYEVRNTRYTQEKKLYLYYDINNNREEFLLTIIDDGHIKLQNLSSDNSYFFEGINYIQYKPNAKRIKHSKLVKSSYLKL